MKNKLPSVPRASDQPPAGSVGCNGGFSIRATEAKAFVATLDKLTNEQLADVLAFIFGKLCPNYHSRPAGRE